MEKPNSMRRLCALAMTVRPGEVWKLGERGYALSAVFAELKRVNLAGAEAVADGSYLKVVTSDWERIYNLNLRWMVKGFEVLDVEGKVTANLRHPIIFPPMSANALSLTVSPEVVERFWIYGESFATVTR